MRLLKMVAALTALMGLFGCKNTPPLIDIADGPGMIYVDSEYRTEFANCLSPDYDDFELWGDYSCAIAYLGKGEYGKTNRELYIKKLFASLDKNKTNKTEHFDFEGEDWFLIIPRYHSTTYVMNTDNEDLYKAETTEDGLPFTIKGRAKIVIENKCPIEYITELNQDGKILNEKVWDITNINNVNNNK